MHIRARSGVRNGTFMPDGCVEKIADIRSLADFFRGIGESTELQDYRIKMFQTAARLIEAAETLAGGAADRPTG